MPMATQITQSRVLARMRTVKCDEPVSKPLKDSEQAGELEKAEEEVIALFVTDHV